MDKPITPLATDSSLNLLPPNLLGDFRSFTVPSAYSYSDTQFEIIKKYEGQILEGDFWILMNKTHF